jgi:hypothetical protein
MVIIPSQQIPQDIVFIIWKDILGLESPLNGDIQFSIWTSEQFKKTNFQPTGTVADSQEFVDYFRLTLTNVKKSNQNLAMGKVAFQSKYPSAFLLTFYFPTQQDTIQYSEEIKVIPPSTSFQTTQEIKNNQTP